MTSNITVLSVFIRRLIVSTRMYIPQDDAQDNVCESIYKYCSESA